MAHKGFLLRAILVLTLVLYSRAEPESKIAFTSVQYGQAAEIYVMDADGANPINLTNHPKVDTWPAWSPDGTRIAFQSNRDGNSDIYVMAADGLKRLTTKHRSKLSISLLNTSDLG